MITIERATEKDASLLSEIGKTTFIESHGSSASNTEIGNYVARTYLPEVLHDELLDHNNIYHILYLDGQPAGFSKIILNTTYDKSNENNLTKLERLYFLRKYYDLKLGRKLFEFILELVRAHNQDGIWLYVWTENPRAIRFYENCGFIINGKHSFKISETHSNPNYRMILKFHD